MVPSLITTPRPIGQEGKTYNHYNLARSRTVSCPALYHFIKIGTGSCSLMYVHAYVVNK